MATLMSAPPTSRVGRYPKHNFNIYSQPFQLRPFMLAPVLPAETLQSAYFEDRVITDPVANSIIGWKKEYFWFYVRMSDLLRDAIKEMFVDPANTDLSATLGIAADDNKYYTAKGGVPWSEYCMERVCTHYFRDDGETWNSPTIGGLPMAQIRDQMYLDSLTDESEMPEGEEIADATDMGDFERLMLAFEQLRAMGLTEMTYEDYLRSHGISVADPTEGKPELIWHISDFQYPSNTINPATGSPSSAVSWVFKQSLRKSKMFKEPGFIFGVTVTRPKIYFGALYGSAAAHMTRAWDWVPAMLAAEPMTSLKHFDAGKGPLGDRSGSGAATESEYWLDMRDIFLYGDQWLENPYLADMTTSRPVQIPRSHSFPLPTWKDGEDALVSKYLNAADIPLLFATEAVKYIREDGFVSLSIKGKQIDYTKGATLV